MKNVDVLSGLESGKNYLTGKGRERFNERSHSEMNATQWEQSVIEKHKFQPTRRELIVTPEETRQELEEDRYQCALWIMSSIQDHNLDMYGIDWRGGKVGKLQLNDYFRESEIRCTGAANYVELIATIKKLNEDFTVVLTTEPDAFMRLGCNRVDDSSCYRADHEFQYAPAIIGDNHGTFIAYLKTPDDTVVARCFGIEGSAFKWIDSGGTRQERSKMRQHWCMTNFYSRGMSKAVAVAAFKSAMRTLKSDDIGAHPIKEVDINGCGGVYLNEDAIGTGGEFTIESNGMSRSLMLCHCCDEHCIDEDDECYIHVADLGHVCECCSENYIYLDNECHYVSYDDAVEDVHGDMILMNTATELYDGQYASPSENVVEIGTGGHQGEMALADDDDLMYTTCCEESYIEGSL